MRLDRLSDAQLALRPHRVTGPVMAAFLDAAAIVPERAMVYRPATPKAEQEFRRLVAGGVLRAGRGGHWFDLRRHYTVERAAAERRAVIGLAAALTIAAFAVLFYRG